MSKRAYISRYLIILKKLKTKPYISYNELEAHMNQQFRHLQLMDEDIELAFSKRTWLRDKREINNLFGIAIDYSTKHQGYCINETQNHNQYFERIIEEFDIFSSLNLAHEAAPFIHLENRKPQGTDNLYGLLDAIKQKQQIQFTYQKFWEEKPSKRTVEPYALKEFKNRWYLMAMNLQDGIVKSFALDRLTNLSITNNPFTVAINYNIEDNYRYCFGIISPNNEKPQTVVLSFDPYQGKYIKTLPLHATQQILLDDEEELQIQLTIYITHDFVMELLSFGSHVKVLQPLALIDEMKHSLQDALGQY